MPYFPKDLKRVLKSTRKHGLPFGDGRAVRIVNHLLQAVRHLKVHGIVHRDVKLDTSSSHVSELLGRQTRTGVQHQLEARMAEVDSLAEQLLVAEQALGAAAAAGSTE